MKKEVKMKKLLFFLVVSSYFLVAAAQNLTYTNEKAGYKFVYFPGWTVKAEADEVSVFSPETKIHPRDTLDVERGLKVEFVKLPGGQKDFKKVLRENKYTPYKIILRNGKEHIQIYSSYNQGMLFLMTFDPGKNILITGYIPDQKNWKDFEGDYAIMVASFEGIKNDKDGSP